MNSNFSPTHPSCTCCLELVSGQALPSGRPPLWQSDYCMVRIKKRHSGISDITQEETTLAIPNHLIS